MVIKKKEDNKSAVMNIAESRQVPFAVVEAYKAIRTNLTFLLSNSKTKVFGITSPEAGEGKSTTSVNMAIAFSQLGDKVLLIDADMRKSSIHKKLKIENDAGLSNILAGFNEYKDVITHINDTFDVITAGQVPPNPSELLGSVRFKELVEAVSKEYSYTAAVFLSVICVRWIWRCRTVWLPRGQWHRSQSYIQPIHRRDLPGLKSCSPLRCCAAEKSYARCNQNMQP